MNDCLIFSGLLSNNLGQTLKFLDYENAVKPFSSRITSGRINYTASQNGVLMLYAVQSTRTYTTIMINDTTIYNYALNGSSTPEIITIPITLSIGDTVKTGEDLKSDNCISEASVFVPFK